MLVKVRNAWSLKSRVGHLAWRTNKPNAPLSTNQSRCGKSKVGKPGGLPRKSLVGGNAGAGGGEAQALAGLSAMLSKKGSAWGAKLAGFAAKRGEERASGPSAAAVVAMLAPSAAPGPAPAPAT